jgi:hypothetical protein
MVFPYNNGGNIWNITIYNLQTMGAEATKNKLTLISMEIDEDVHLCLGYLRSLVANPNRNVQLVFHLSVLWYTWSHVCLLGWTRSISTHTGSTFKKRHNHCDTQYWHHLWTARQFLLPNFPSCSNGLTIVWPQKKQFRKPILRVPVNWVYWSFPNNKPDSRSLLNQKWSFINSLLICFMVPALPKEWWCYFKFHYCIYSMCLSENRRPMKHCLSYHNFLWVWVSVAICCH